jgi:hypothetical protein
MFGARVDITKERSFTRSDLALKKWQSLFAQKTNLMQSSLKIRLDSEFVVVRDMSKQIRHLKLGDPADEDLIKRYASDDYIKFLEDRCEAKATGNDAAPMAKTSDALFAAAAANSNMYTPKPAKKEQGVTIQTDLAFKKPEESKKE